MEDETIPADCEYPEMSYEDRLSEASENARLYYSNAVSENHQMLGVWEREYGLEYGTLDDYRID